MSDDDFEHLLAGTSTSVETDSPAVAGYVEAGAPEEEAGEIVTMILECCSQERSYQRFYGLLGQRM